jgi:hypothetical protein
MRACVRACVRMSAHFLCDPMCVIYIYIYIYICVCMNVYVYMWCYLGVYVCVSSRFCFALMTLRYGSRNLHRVHILIY